MSTYSLLLCCWKRVFVMTSAFSWQNSISLCPASFLIPRPNLPVTPGVSWLVQYFSFLSSFPSHIQIPNISKGLYQMWDSCSKEVIATVGAQPLFGVRDIQDVTVHAHCHLHPMILKQPSSFLIFAPFPDFVVCVLVSILASIFELDPFSGNNIGSS